MYRINIEFTKNGEKIENRIELEYKGYRVIGIVKIPKIEIEYPKNYDNSKAGKYEITIIVNGEKYTSTLNIIDTWF